MVCGTSNDGNSCCGCGCPFAIGGEELVHRRKAYQEGIELGGGAVDVSADQSPLRELPRFWLLRWIARHWRGGYSLGVSYWLNDLPRWGILVVLAVLLLAQPVTTHRLEFWLIAVIELLLLGYVWVVVGVWRSADRHIRETGRRFWARCAQASMVLSAVGTTYSFVGNIGMATDKLALYRALDNMPKLSITTDTQGRRLLVDGALGPGSGDVIATAIASHPNLRVVQLSGPGGLLNEARIAGRAVRNAQLATFVATECNSACTLIFMSSRQRVLYRNASLGFHSPLMAPLTVANLFAYAAAMRKELTQLGATDNFAALASSIDSQTLWRPDADMLLANHVATSLTDMKDWDGVQAGPNQSHGR
jgi:hypothetical protein